MECLVNGCSGVVVTMGLCSRHYMRHFRNGGPLVRKNKAYLSIEDKLSDYTVSENGCWIWNAGKNNKGYGTIYHNGKKRYAHRLSYELVNGENPLFVLHKCDNPSCINPDHLFAGTHKDNMQDAVKKGRMACGEKISKILTKDDVIDIRALSQKEAMTKYNLSQSTISGIQTRRNWKKV